MCFNPRAREGATRETLSARLTAAGFNPRAREGATYVVSRYRNGSSVSIHAPVRARPQATRATLICLQFQSTRP